MLSETEYQTYVTGLPQGIVFSVANPDTGDAFDFAGRDDDALVFTIGSLAGMLRSDGRLEQATQEHFLGMAVYQMKVAAGTPVRWVCQGEVDAVAVEAALKDYEREIRMLVPLGSISVVALVPVGDA